MLSEIPLKIGEKNKEKQILRAGMIAELDATNLYEQMADKSSNPKVRKIMLDVAKEEKTHMGEFLTLLLRMDREQMAELEKGRKEVTEKLGKVI
jgi:rubrerythrin